MSPRKRAVKKAAGKKSRNKKQLSDLEILQEIQDDIFQKLRSSDYQPRVADLIRVLTEKLKLKFSDDGRKKFWDLIEQIRREELAEEEENEEDE